MQIREMLSLMCSLDRMQQFLQDQKLILRSLTDKSSRNINGNIFFPGHIKIKNKIKKSLGGVPLFQKKKKCFDF